MKNIRIYVSPKYSSPEYDEVESGIYKTCEKESDNSLSLKQVTNIEDMSDEDNTIFVTSFMFEQEPEFGENTPFDAQVSQYPLEDILDKFMCACSDFYEDENISDDVNSYMEFSSPDIEDIRGLLSIVGKHVYNKQDGEYIKLVVE